MCNGRPKVYEGRIAATAAALAAKDETIAELRRRPEAAAAERAELRGRLAALEATARPALGGDHTADIARSSAAAAAHLVESRQVEGGATAPAPTLWQHLRRAFGGG